MNTNVDLSQLAIDRAGSGTRVGSRRHLVTRYILPAALLLGLAGVIAWAGYGVVFPGRPVTVVPVLATTTEVRVAGTPLFQAAGWVEPRPTPVRVAALAPGVVEELLVVPDQAVVKGQVIVRLIDVDARLAVERAEADLKLILADEQSAAAALKAAESRLRQPTHLQAALGEAEAALAKIETELASLPFQQRQAEARLASARRNFDGKTSAGEAVAERLVQDAHNQYESARAGVEELASRGDALGNEKNSLVRRRDALSKQLELKTDEHRAHEQATASLRAAEARVERARLDLQEAELRRERMTVRAPIDGRVLRLVAHPGARLSMSRGGAGEQDASTVVTLYRPEMLQVRVDVRFEDLPRVLLGQAVMIRSPAVPAAFHGEVLFFGSEADVQKNTLEVKVAIDSPPPVLKPEMLVGVTFLAPDVPERSDASSEELRLLIPQALVRHGEQGDFVWVADQTAGEARRTPVELGLPGGDGLVEILRGLTPTSRLIAAGHEDLTDGERIRITGEEPPR